MHDSQWVESLIWWTGITARPEVYICKIEMKSEGKSYGIRYTKAELTDSGSFRSVYERNNKASAVQAR